jgi:DNA-binding NtrC family response regulator
VARERTKKGRCEVDRRILIIDDDTSMLDTLRAELESRDYDVAAEVSPESALRRLAEQDFSVVLTDINMRGMNGVDLCKEVVSLREETPVIVMTAFASVESAVGAIRAGAYDFVTKPFTIEGLIVTIERGLKHRALREEVKRLQRAVDALHPCDEMVGESAAMKKMYDIIVRVAETDATVLVVGESGTGKEVVSRMVHDRSPRASGPFVAISCAAMPEPLLESELFGHTKGAFTDARSARPGLFAKASGGTLFLDEVGEMPLGMQAKLLRALQERKVRPVGGDVEVPFDVRIVAATNRDLEAEVRRGAFREDLFYRINVVQVQVPALRDRENDALLLAQSFLKRCNSNRDGRVVGFKSAAAEKLTSYPWPGNVRELQNCVERAVALAQFDHIGVEDLPDKVSHSTAVRALPEACDPAAILPMDEVERRHIGQVLIALNGNKASAARLLGMDRRTLYRKLERWGLSAVREGRAGGLRSLEPAGEELRRVS